MPVQSVTAMNEGVMLAGSLWTPDAAPVGVVLMVPGSGPSDRDNDVLFPPIRAHLLALGFAVASFDKRGVDGSTGDWLTAGIETQAQDAIAELATVRALVDVDIPRVGMFGHSQGGWVVLEAAARIPLDFVITNSGPAVSPGVQESFSTANRLADADADAGAGIDRERARDAVALFDDLMTLAGRGVPFAHAEQLLAANVVAAKDLENAGAFLPDDAAVWSFISLIVDYDPVPALRRSHARVLALLGEADEVVPVGASTLAYRDAVAPGLLHLGILPGADHRMQTADGEFVPDYFPTIDRFLGIPATPL